MNDKLSAYRDFVKSVRSSIGYWKSYSLLQFTLATTRVMRLDKVSGKKLAARLGISATQVSKVLKGNENITIETMAKFADALGAAVHIHVAKKGVHVQWQELSGIEYSQLEDIQLKSRSVRSVLTPSTYVSRDSGHSTRHGIRPWVIKAAWGVPVTGSESSTEANFQTVH